MNAEIKDWASLIPLEPNPEVLDWLRGQGELIGELLIYKCCYVKHPIEGVKNMVKVKCTSCGEVWYEEKIHRDTCGYYKSDSLGFINSETKERIYHKDSVVCPACGMRGEAYHSTHISRYGMYYDCCTVMIIELIEDRLVPIVYQYELWFYPDGEKKILCRRLESYIPDGRKCIRCCGYYKYFTTVKMLDCWEQKARYDVTVSNPSYIYPFDKEIIEQSTTPHCKLDKYIHTKDPQVAEYLNIYLKYPNVENLITQGLGSFFNKSMYGSYYSPRKTLTKELFDLKKKRPCEILKLTKEEYNIFQKNRWTQDQLLWYRKNKNKIKLSDAEELFEWSTCELDKLLDVSPDSYMRLFRYVNKQNKQADITVDINYYRDYLHMAQDNGEDITDERVLYPQKLVNAHNYQVKRKKYKEDKKLREGFAKRYKELIRYAYCDDELGLMIFPAKNEKELYIEGKLLNHCVGTYAARHANGNTNIFFIRKVHDPETPFYTLELSESSRRKGTVNVIQNRGANNCERTPEVIEFEAQWRAWLTEKLNEEANKNE